MDCKIPLLFVIFHIEVISPCIHPPVNGAEIVSWRVDPMVLEDNAFAHLDGFSWPRILGSDALADNEMEFCQLVKELCRDHHFTLLASSFIASSTVMPLRSASKLRMMRWRRTGRAISLISSLLTWFLPLIRALAFAARIMPMEARGEAPYWISCLFCLVARIILTALLLISLAMGTCRVICCRPIRLFLLRRTRSFLSLSSPA